MTCPDPVNGRRVKTDMNAELAEIRPREPAHQAPLGMLLVACSAVLITAAVPLEIILWRWAL